MTVWDVEITQILSCRNCPFRIEGYHSGALPNPKDYLCELRATEDEYLPCIEEDCPRKV